MPRISSLPQITAVADDDELAIRDKSTTTTKRITLLQLFDWLKTKLAWINSTHIDWSSASGKIWWEELARVDVAAASDSQVVTFAAREHLRILISWQSSGAVRGQIDLFNGDTANNYSQSYQLHQGNAFATDVSINRINIDAVPSNTSDVVDIMIDVLNRAGRAKMVKVESQLSNPAGSAYGVPVTFWAHWNSVNQLTSFRLLNTNTGDFTNVKIIVLGHN